MSYTDPVLSFGEKPSTGWDYVLIFRAPNVKELKKDRGALSVSLKRDLEEAKKAGEVREEVLERLRAARFSYSQLWVPATKTILVRIGLQNKVLHEIAEKKQLCLELRTRYGGGYLAYHQEWKLCYVNYRYKDFFTPAQRLELTLTALQSKEEWGASIDVEKLQVNGNLEDAYPLHDRRQRNELFRHMVLKRWWDPLFRPNFRLVNDYFGTRVSLYFAFLNFFTRMLVGISALSIPFYFLLKIPMNSSWIFMFRSLFSFIVVFWSAYFLKLWKRRNAVLNIQWGHFGSEEDVFSEVRPQFIGTSRRGFYSKGGFVTLDDLDASSLTNINDAGNLSESADEGDEDISRFPSSFRSIIGGFRDDVDFELSNKKTGILLRDLPTYPFFDGKSARRRIMASWVITACFTILMLLFTFAPTFYNKQITDYFAAYSWTAALEDSSAGILTGILIFCSENVWKMLYPTLSKWENHRTEQNHLNSLIIKRFAFEFPANYASLLYIAFVKPYLENDHCVINPNDGMPDCMLELQHMVSSIVITKATIEQVMELIIPTAIIVLKRALLWVAWFRYGRFESRTLRRSLINPEEELNEDKTNASDIKEAGLNTFENTIDDYAELVIQCGYVALFGLAFPLAPLVFFINNLIEGRADAFKFLFILNRPPAEKAMSIGRWISILRFITWFSVWVNAAILSFTSDRNAAEAGLRKTTEFLVFQNIFLFMILAVNYAQDDIPGRTLRRKARQDYLIARWFQIHDKPYYKYSTAPRRKNSMNLVDINGDLSIVSEKYSL